MTLTATSEVPAGSGRPYARVLTDRCAGCQECVIRCPTGALSMDTERWVAHADGDLCVGCRQCERTCPFSAIVIEGPLLVAPRTDPAPAHPAHLPGDVSEIRSGFAGWPEALAEAARCLECPDPTCVRGCPAHNDIPGFIAAVRNRDLEGAHGILRRTSVLPDICSRVCNQAAQCEGACSWSLAGGAPVAIGRLERFVADTLPVPPPAPAPASVTGELSVGIIGSGPAAAGAAWELIEAGASVTVYEKDTTPGGLCNWGIPDFTLPEAVAARPWQQLTAAGVDLRCGTEIHPEDLDRLLGAHDAVIMAHGASVPLRLSVPGADLGGVTDATTFLQGAKAALAVGGDPDGFCATLGLAGEDTELAGRPPRGLVVGAGNIYRGIDGAAKGIDRATGDYMGMLATVLNALMLQDALEDLGRHTRVLSAIDVKEVAEPYIRRRAIRHLEKGRVVIFAAGTGNPFFTTDSAAALRAVELGADLLLKATKVDGVYTSDPTHHSDAVRYERLSYDQVIERKLAVMDTAAIALCRDQQVPLRIYNMTVPGNLMPMRRTKPRISFSRSTHFLSTVFRPDRRARTR